MYPSYSTVFAMGLIFPFRYGQITIESPTGAPEPTRCSGLGERPGERWNDPAFHRAFQSILTLLYLRHLAYEEKA